MRRIIINGRFLVHQITGVERYAREILQELDKIINRNEIFLAVPSDVRCLPDYKNIKVVKVGKLKNIMWEHISFPLYTKKMGGISLNLCNTAPLFSPGIVCIHDMKIKAVPQYFSKKFLIWYRLVFKYAIKNAKKIITVSEFSKGEILKYYNVNEEKIIVIPNAWQHYINVQYDENTHKKYGLEKGKYYFSMGSMEPNKNFKWVAATALNFPDTIFAVSGSVNKAVFAKTAGFICPGNMKFLGYVSDEEAKTLMRDCKGFLFPSFYEGFGIPPLEAMSAGCKNVIVSDTAVMHEVFGSNAGYINPEIPAYNLDFAQCNKNHVLEKYSWVYSAKKLKKLLMKL